MTEQALIWWGFGLLLAALLLIVIEVFVPSGGIIGITASVVAIAGVVTFWRVSWIWGGISLATVLVLAPLAFNFAMRIMPNTPMGRQLILSHDETEAERRAAETARQAERDQALIGAVGLALTDLRPVGVAEFEGEKLEVLAEGGAVNAGSKVRVTAVSGNQVKVRAVV